MTCRDFLGKGKSTDVCISLRGEILVVVPFLPTSRYGISISAYGSAVRGFIWREKRSRFAVDRVTYQGTSGRVWILVRTPGVR